LAVCLYIEYVDDLDQIDRINIVGDVLYTSMREIVLAMANGLVANQFNRLRGRVDISGQRADCQEQSALTIEARLAMKKPRKTQAYFDPCVNILFYFLASKEKSQKSRYWIRTNRN